MDYVDILFNKERPFAPIKISGGTTNGRVVKETQRTFRQNLEAFEREMFEDDIHDIRHQLNHDIKTSMKTNNYLDSHTLDYNDDVIYKIYKFDQRSQSAMRLPIYGSKDKILSKIRQYPSVVIEGNTGCGKSTQVSKILYIYMSFSHKIKVNTK